MFTRTGLLAGVFSVVMSLGIQAQDLKSAIQLTKSESYDKAEEMYNALIQKEPGNSKYYFYLGRTIFSIILPTPYPIHWLQRQKRQVTPIRRVSAPMQMIR